MRAGKRRQIRDGTAWWDVMVALCVVLGVALLFWMHMYISLATPTWHYPQTGLSTLRIFWADSRSLAEQPLTMFSVLLFVLSVWLYVLFLTIRGGKRRRLLPERLALAAGFVMIVNVVTVTDVLADLVMTGKYRPGWIYYLMPDYLISPDQITRRIPDLVPYTYNKEDRYWIQIGENRAFLPDGDTIQFGETGYRLWGIDALEAEQLCQIDDRRPVQCGHQARDAFLDVMSSAGLTCIFPDQARYPRTISCHAGGQDVSEWLVRRGYAFPVGEGLYRYGEALRAARVEKAGAWATTFLYPWEWKDASCERIAGFCRKAYDAD